MFINKLLVITNVFLLFLYLFSVNVPYTRNAFSIMVFWTVSSSVKKDMQNDIINKSISVIEEKCNDTSSEYYKENIKTCLIDETENFVDENVNEQPDNPLEDFFYTNNDVQHTLNDGGDCENKAILMSIILKRLGFDKVYLVDQENHVCVMVVFDGNVRFINCSEYLEFFGIGKI